MFVEKEMNCCGVEFQTESFEEQNVVTKIIEEIKCV